MPIPPDAERYASRGYSAPHALGKRLSQSCCIPLVDDLLFKTRPTQDLRQVGAGQRRAEIAGSMAVQEKRAFLAEGACLLLIDDVVTYGTHFSEATSVLKQNGASKVYATALATARDNLTPINRTES